MTQQTIKQEFETVIGLEVHLQLRTKSKIFCGCANIFGQAPNTAVCPVCLGLPGTLPVLNRAALDYAIKIAMALNCEVNPFIKFDRKNYYYPDLPKGYQISQFDLPIGGNGFINVHTPQGVKPIRIHRTHLEEDAGKLIHDVDARHSLVDYNRTGTPLMEIVTEPDMRSPEEAYDYLTTLKLILQYLEVSDCDMEKGSLRCDANVSIREKGETKLGTKTELKNMNSFKAVKMALEFEVNRQCQVRLSGERIVQETRLWDETKMITATMRSKEEAHDYRYFPEPDLAPFTVSPTEIEAIKKSIPELPEAKLKRFVQQYQLSEYDAQIIIQDSYLANFFEQCAEHYPLVKKIANWIIGPLQEQLNSRKAAIRQFNLKTEIFIGLIDSVEKGVISNLVGKDILPLMIDSGRSAEAIIREQGLAQVSDDGVLEQILFEVIAENEKIVEQIKQGKESAVGFLVGQAMRKSQGKANPKRLNEILKRRLLNG